MFAVVVNIDVRSRVFVCWHCVCMWVVRDGKTRQTFPFICLFETKHSSDVTSQGNVIKRSSTFICLHYIPLVNYQFLFNLPFFVAELARNLLQSSLASCLTMHTTSNNRLLFCLPSPIHNHHQAATHNHHQVKKRFESCPQVFITSFYLF